VRAYLLFNYRRNYYTVWVCVFLFCKCSVPKAFLEASVTAKLDYFIGVTTYIHMTSEHVVYRPTSTLDKLIIFNVPIYIGTTWTQLSAVPLNEMLVFLDDYPNFIVRCRMPPASPWPFSPGASAYPSPQLPTPSSPFSDAAYCPPTPTPPPTHPNSFNRVLTSFPPYVFEAVSDKETEKELNFVYKGSVPYWEKSQQKLLHAAANEIKTTITQECCCRYVSIVSNMISDYYNPYVIIKLHAWCERLLALTLLINRICYIMCVCVNIYIVLVHEFHILYRRISSYSIISVLFICLLLYIYTYSISLWIEPIMWLSTVIYRLSFEKNLLLLLSFYIFSKIQK